MDNKLKDLYEEHNIDKLRPGARSDALGDVYEKFVKLIFSDQELVYKFNMGTVPSSTEEKVMYDVCRDFGILFIESVNFPNVPKTDVGGEPKTDLCILINGNTLVKATIKQSRAREVTISEFDVASIVEGIGIKDPMTISLMEKHQRDASAKNFAPEEKEYLTNGMQIYKRDLVRWAISGAVDDSEDLRVANYSINFRVDSNTNRFVNFVTHSIESLVDKIVKFKRGFNTGLSWTYATGTKGKKIQFKGPTFTH